MVGVESFLPHPSDKLRHRKLLNADLLPFMNLTFIVEGPNGRERFYSMRSVIEQRCASLLLAVSFIKKKKEKKGDLMGPVRTLCGVGSGSDAWNRSHSSTRKARL
jgi:hypothetical protein